MWDKNKNGVILRLEEKWLEDWESQYGEAFEWMGVSKDRIVSEDVTNIPDEQLSKMLDDIHCELIPEDCEEEQ